MNLSQYWKKLVVAALCVLAVPVVNKSLPIVRVKESFREVFPEEKFRAKLEGPVPAWMRERIALDLREFEERKISKEALDKTYERICQTVSQKTPFYRYRILDNELYKFTPNGARFAEKDIALEKAFKTLLIYAKVPDVDFILCPMDGMPEPYMPPNFFLVEEALDQAPILAQAKLREPLTHAIVLIPDQFSLQEEWPRIFQEITTLNQEINWEQKQEAALWRGSLTDTGLPNEEFVPHFASCPRFNLCKQSLQFPSIIDAGFSGAVQTMRPTLQNENVMKEGLGKRDHLLYKYLPVLDGHMCTYTGYQWRLLSNSVCFKQESDQIQWFYAMLQPYVHYVPIRNDLSDLVEKIEWAKSHDQEVQKISRQAQEFALRHLTFEDHYLYLYLVFQKLASLEKFDFSLLKKETKKDPRWKCIQYRKRLALKKSMNRTLKIIYN